ncbi:DUF3108 domain-containing protein [Pedobacter alpinus]|uniref:DUF3108 domain-containing protein n=1 Tax=Pedobacter alpinus TaxID=1590643 RepID=A0ABW5TNI0_9SPHI
MRKHILTLILIAFVFGNGFSQTIDYLDKSAFKAGETIKYKLKYGFFTAAEATIQVLATDVKLNNKPTYHLLVQGQTSGSFDVFYKVRNRYDSYIDKDNYSPYLYTENVRENKYTRNDKARFYQNEKKVVATKGTFKSPVNQTFDLVSAYYFTRNLDLKGIKVGDKIVLNYFLDDEVTPLTIEYFGKEIIKTNLGQIACLKFSPSIRPGRVFKKDSRLFLWISDDANRIPVKAQAEVLVGSINMEISSASGLVKPLNTQ